MHAKLFVELGVEVESRLALISTQLNSSLAGMVASLCIAASAQKQPNRWLGTAGAIQHSCAIKQ
jgi:hypothetical protein